MRNAAKTKHRKPNYSAARNKQEAKAIKLHEALAEFEDFKATILPALKKDLKSGMSAKQLREKYAALVQARSLSDALTTERPSEAAPIIKDVLDRVEGKATEKKEVTHRFKDMNDDELDAILDSEKKELEEMNKRFDN